MSVCGAALHLVEVISVCPWLTAHLGLIPLLRLLHVLGGDVLILSTDVPQGSSEVRTGLGLHFKLHLLGLYTHLHILNLLQRVRAKQSYDQLLVYPLK